MRLQKTGLGSAAVRPDIGKFIHAQKNSPSHEGLFFCGRKKWLQSRIPGRIKISRLELLLLRIFLSSGSAFVAQDINQFFYAFPDQKQIGSGVLDFFFQGLDQVVQLGQALAHFPRRREDLFDRHGEIIGDPSEEKSDCGDSERENQIKNITAGFQHNFKLS